MSMVVRVARHLEEAGIGTLFPSTLLALRPDLLGINPSVCPESDR